MHQESRGFPALSGVRGKGAQSVERFILEVRMEAVRLDIGVKKGGESRFSESKTGVLVPYEILLQRTLLDFV